VGALYSWGKQWSYQTMNFQQTDADTCIGHQSKRTTTLQRSSNPTRTKTQLFYWASPHLVSLQLLLVFAACQPEMRRHRRRKATSNLHRHQQPSSSAFADKEEDALW